MKNPEFREGVDFMIQPTLFDKSNETPKKRPRVTVFRLEELFENQEVHQETPKIITTPKRLKWTHLTTALDKIGGNIRGTWAAPILGLLFYTLLLGCGIIAVFCLIGLIFSAAGFLVGGAINLAFNHPVFFFILLCLVGAVYLIIVSRREKSAEVMPIVEDNTGLFD